MESENILFLIQSNHLSSKNKTIIKDDKSQVYYLDEFFYSINDEILKGKNILSISNFGLPKSDKAYFSQATIDLKKSSFLGKDVQIEIHNDVFGNKENNPRIYGVSGKSDKDKSILNKAIFTSCKK